MLSYVPERDLEEFFKISLDDEVWRAGETLKGVLTVCLKHYLGKGIIKLKVHGVSKTSWKEQDSGTGRISRYTDEKLILEEVVSMWDKDVRERTRQLTLAPGRHRFPFEILLPIDCPSSFDGKHGYIQYVCQAIISKPFKNPIEIRKPFTMLCRPPTASFSSTSNQSVTASPATPNHTASGGQSAAAAAAVTSSSNQTTINRSSQAAAEKQQSQSISRSQNQSLALELSSNNSNSPKKNDNNNKDPPPVSEGVSRCGSNAEGIRCEVRLRKSDYVPGEIISIQATIVNNSASASNQQLIQSVTASLIRLVIYVGRENGGQRSLRGAATKERTKEKETVAESVTKHETILGTGGTQIWNREGIPIPSTAPTHTRHDQLIRIKYEVEFDVDGFVTLRLPIRICSPPRICSSPSPPGQPSSFSSNSPPGIMNAPPTYEECVYGLDSSSATAGGQSQFSNRHTSYSPRYPMTKPTPPARPPPPANIIPKSTIAAASIPTPFADLTDSDLTTMGAFAVAPISSADILIPTSNSAAVTSIPTSNSAAAASIPTSNLAAVASIPTSNSAAVPSIPPTSDDFLTEANNIFPTSPRGPTKISTFINERLI